MAQMEAKFEEKFAMMYMQAPPPTPCYQQPPPHTVYLKRQQQPPATINIPAPHPKHQQQAYQPISRKRAKRGRGPCSATGGNHGWNQGGQTYYQQGGHHTVGYSVQDPGVPTPPCQQQQPEGNTGVSYSNTMKIINNVSY